MNFKRKAAAVLLSGSVMLCAGLAVAPTAQAGIYSTGENFIHQGAGSTWVVYKKRHLINLGYRVFDSGCQFLGPPTTNGTWHCWVSYET